MALMVVLSLAATVMLEEKVELQVLLKEDWLEVHSLVLAV